MLGLWIEQTEGAKFWLKVMNELRTRGVGDILIAVVDGLTGFPDAIGTVFPQTAVQTCIVHLIRNSLAFVSWKDRKKVMPDLRAIYRAETAEAAAARLERAVHRQWCGALTASRSGHARAVATVVRSAVLTAGYQVRPRVSAPVGVDASSGRTLPAPTRTSERAETATTWQ